MQVGRFLLAFLVIVSAAGTAVADLSYMHASNEAWAPHAKLHAVWGVTHVVATHSIGLFLLLKTSDLFRVRIAVLILLAYMGSFFVTLGLAPLFGGAIAPDVPLSEMPAKPLGIDGNIFSFLVGILLVLLGWWLCERAARAVN